MKEKTITVRSSEREQILIVTHEVNAALAELTGGDGICTIVVPHTTCAISVNENADPDVPADLTRALRAMIPNVRFDHGEGNSDAHLLSIFAPGRGNYAYISREREWQQTAGFLGKLTAAQARFFAALARERVTAFPDAVPQAPVARYEAFTGGERPAGVWVVRRGRLTESQLAWVYQFREGRLRSGVSYPTRGEALRAVTVAA